MKKTWTILLAALLTFLSLSSGLAEAISLNGTVVSAETQKVE